MASRGNITLTDNTGTKHLGVNVGDLISKRLKGNALFRQSLEHVTKVLFRIYGPKTFFMMTEAVIPTNGTTFKMKGYVGKPVHGKTDIFETDSVPVTIEFAIDNGEVDAA